MEVAFGCFRADCVTASRHGRLALVDVIRIFLPIPKGRPMDDMAAFFDVFQLVRQACG